MQNQIEYKKDAPTSADDASAASEKEKYASKLGNDLYIIGQAWVMVLRAILVGAKTCFIPTVKAAAPKAPECPKPMGYKELPIYECPHVEFKNHVDNQQSCPNRNHKIIQSALHPHVIALRQEVAKNLDSAKAGVVCTLNGVSKDLETAEKNLKGYMRRTDNESTRQVVMAVGTAVGFFFGGGGGIPRRIFMTGLGAAAAGSLCYPKETDEKVRELLYYASKGLITFYNMYCGKCFSFRKRLPYPSEMPERLPPIPAKNMNCPKK